MSYEYCWSPDDFVEEFERRCCCRLGQAIRRRVVRWDDAATWHPAHRNAHARDDLHRRACAAGRAAWRAEVDELAALGRPVPSAVVRLAWAMHEQRLRHLSATPDQTRLEHLDAIRHLFDFADAPVTTAAPTDVPPPDAEFDYPEDLHPPGPSLDQHVFSTHSSDATLDAFAASLADGTAQAGLHCLAGARGSGKTTTLNRIEWFARHRPYGSPRPVIVRRDLATSIDPATFPAALLSDLCQSVLAHCRRLPQCKPLHPNRPLFALGHVADFCRTNLTRVAFATGPVVLCALWLTFATDRPFPGSLYTLAAALLAILFLGCCAAVGQLISRPISAWTALLLVTFWPAAALLCQSTGYAPVQVLHRTATSAAPYPPAIAAFSLATIFCTGAAILFLPPWWSAYSRAATLLATLRRPSAADPLSDLPAQDLLTDCGRTFGGLLFLLDDADRLPIKDLQHLLRLLRPLAIHADVRIVLTVPPYLHTALLNGPPPDHQAAVPHCHLLDAGLSDLTDPADGPFPPHRRGRFDDRLRDLLVARLRIPLTDPASLPATEPPLSLALSPWLDAPATARDDVLRQIRAAAPSRRDLIRECEALLVDPARRPFPALPAPDPAAERDLVRRLSAEYHGQERALFAEIVQRVAGTDTRIRLIAPPTDLPPARPLDAIPHLDLPTYYLAAPPPPPSAADRT